MVYANLIFNLKSTDDRHKRIEVRLPTEANFGEMIYLFINDFNENKQPDDPIRDLRIETVIGIYDWEREVRQTVSLDLEMATDIRKAAQSDSIEDTLNYKAVAKRLIQFIGDSQFQLVETMSERCAALVLEEFDVSWLRLRLSKPGAVRGSRDVGIIIERGVKA